MRYMPSFLIDQNGHRVRKSFLVDADGRKVVGQTEDLRHWVRAEDGEYPRTVEATPPVVKQYVVDTPGGPSISDGPVRFQHRHFDPEWSIDHETPDPQDLK